VEVSAVLEVEAVVAAAASRFGTWLHFSAVWPLRTPGACARWRSDVSRCALIGDLQTIQVIRRNMRKLPPLLHCGIEVLPAFYLSGVESVQGERT
jgi:hypothetical protein